MEYSKGEIRQFIRRVVRISKDTSALDTGYLRRSITGDISASGVVVFRQIYYGAYNENSLLIDYAKEIMPKDIEWKVIFEDEEGRETTIKTKTRTGRKLQTKSVTSGNISTSKIKSLISAIQRNNAKEKDNTTERDRESN